MAVGQTLSLLPRNKKGKGRLRETKGYAEPPEFQPAGYFFFSEEVRRYKLR